MLKRFLNNHEKYIIYNTSFKRENVLITEKDIIDLIKLNGKISYREIFQSFHSKPKRNKNKKISEIIRRLKKNKTIVSKGGFLSISEAGQNRNSGLPSEDYIEIADKHKIKINFTSHTLAELYNMDLTIKDNDIKGRTDYRYQNAITIDGADAKDLDDAVYIEQVPNGYRLFVHIADVSHYVKLDGQIDKEALKRGTSVYLVDKVIPMLPKQLSNGICSLNEKVDRLCLTAVIELSKTGKMRKYKFNKGVINVKKRYTYKEVSKVLETREFEIDEIHKPFYTMLKLMEKVANLLTKDRFKKGSIDFDLDELKIECDENSVPINVTLRDRSISHKIIEEFMLKANKAAARFLGKQGNSIFRIHELPDEEKMKSFLEFLKKINFRIKDKEKIRGSELQKILEKVKGTKNSGIVNVLLLRSMKQAVYHTENIGHFGLGFKDYTHFTSPIRRYPDLMVHRLIKTKLKDGKKIKKLESKPFLSRIALKSSKLERVAMEAERDIVKIKCARFLEKMKGEIFQASVSGLTEFGVFVKISPYGIEGLIRIRDLNGYFTFDEDNYVLRGDRGISYHLGDKVKVKLINVSVRKGFIDFKIAD